MKLHTVSDLIESIRLRKIDAECIYQKTQNFDEQVVKQVTSDSRKVSVETLFVAIRGIVSNGHDFIESAIEKGACAILVDREFYKFKIAKIPEYFTSKKILYIVSDSPLRDMALISDIVYSSPHEEMFITGITGTNGKTTTSYLMEKALEPCALFGTIDYRIKGRIVQSGSTTTPMSCEISHYLAQARDMGVKNAVMEVSSHALCLNRVSHLKFNSAVFTNLTPEHMDFHADMEHYYQSKKSLFKLLKPSGKACICVDFEWGQRLALSLYTESLNVKNSETKNSNKNSEIVCFASDFESIEVLLNNFSLFFNKRGLLSTNTRDYIKEKHIMLVYAKNREITSNGIKMEVHVCDCNPDPDKQKLEIMEEFNFESGLTSHFNIPNLLGAFSGLLNSGLDHQEICERICSINRVPGRFDTAVYKGVTAIVDYAHSPDAVDNALQAVHSLRKIEESNGRIIVLFGCGGDRDSRKRPLMGKVATELSDYAIVTSDNPRTEDPEFIISNILEGIDLSEDRYEVIVSRRDAIKRAADISEPGDYVILLGKGHEDYQIVGRKKYHFDDFEELKDSFKNK